MSEIRKAQPFITPLEYLRSERAAAFKSEYYNGEMFAMAGASPVHVRINSTLGGMLYNLTRGGRCFPLNNDMRVRITGTGLYTYPDQIIVCGDMEVEDDDVLLNPKVIFEVLSPTTEKYDRGGKFDHYKAIPSLMEYVLISQVKPHVDQYVRQPDDRWLLTTYIGLDAVLVLGAVPASLPLAELYHGVRLPPALSLYDDPVEP